MRNTSKKICILSLLCLSVFAVTGGVGQLQATSDAPKTVYVSSTGNDGNEGTQSFPYRTLNCALENVENGGVIVLQDSVSIDGWSAHEKTVTITGGTLDATSLNALQIWDNVTFENLQLSVNANQSIFANGYTVVIDENVVLSNAVDVYGGGNGTTVAGTDLTLLSGTYRYIYGGSLKGTVDGDTHLTVGGSVNADIDVSNHNGTQHIFGGGNGDTVTGNTCLKFGGNAKSIHIFGGANGGGKIGGTANTSVTGGASMSIYGAGKEADGQCNTKLVVTGGSFEQVFGGSERATLTGNVDLRMLGGTITRRIYGGCYNDTSGLSFSTSYAVTGNIDLTIGSGANITYAYDGNDKSVYAHSRHSSNAAGETANLIFADKTAYDNYKNGNLKLGAQDFAMKMIIGSLSVADQTHYYTYSAEDGVITQTCAYHTDFSSTATVCVDNGALQYTGKEITPVYVTYGENWKGDLLVISYQDNVKEGLATYAVTGETTLWTGTFAIRKAPVVIGSSIRLSEPAGLRFQSKVSLSLVEEGATFGTLMIPAAVLGEQKLTHEVASVRDVPQTKWATESVKTESPERYEEGYAYFNAVLTDIPEEHYDKIIVASSYACLNGVYYYSESVERSVAQVASCLIKAGYTEDVLFDYVDKAIPDGTLALAQGVTLLINETYSLNVTGNKNCAIIWRSSDTSIVQVDDNGKLSAGNTAGTAVVTAQVGSRILQCAVTVEYRWTGFI